MYPSSWEAPGSSLARRAQLRWATLTVVFEAARAFLDPVLGEPLDAAWDPGTWSWTLEPKRAYPLNRSPVRG